ncbi:MAG: acyl-CoA carboxylase subunit epsilon, partial [Streptomycetaceae bacterium]|nr:acyl-CoA carboxylase subunit epsilon [Streptomycetaceae bacterium]
MIGCRRAPAGPAASGEGVSVIKIVRGEPTPEEIAAIVT